MSNRVVKFFESLPKKFKQYWPTIVKDLIGVILPYLVKLGLSAMAKDPEEKKADDV